MLIRFGRFVLHCLLLIYTLVALDIIVSFCMTKCSKSLCFRVNFMKLGSCTRKLEMMKRYGLPFGEGVEHRKWAISTEETMYRGAFSMSTMGRGSNFVHLYFFIYCLLFLLFRPWRCSQTSDSLNTQR